MAEFVNSATLNQTTIFSPFLSLFLSYSLFFSLYFLYIEINYLNINKAFIFVYYN